MNKKIILLTLLFFNTIQSTTLKIITGRRDLALTVLRKSYKNLDQTIDDIERVEDALEKSHKEKKKEINQKFKLNLTEAIRFLESARRRLDKIEEKQNPLYYYNPPVYTSKDFSFDTLTKNRQDEPQSAKTSSKTINITPQKTYKLILFIFIMSLILQKT